MSAGRRSGSRSGSGSGAAVAAMCAACAAVLLVAAAVALALSRGARLGGAPVSQLSAVAASPLSARSVDRVVALSLPRQLARRAHLDRQRPLLRGLPPLEIIDAVDGKALCAGIDYSRRGVPPALRPHLTDTGWDHMREAALHPGRGTIWHLTPGAVGCALSHARLWREAAERGVSLLVLEDDAEVRAPVRPVLDRIHRDHPDACVRGHILYLGYGEQGGDRPLPRWASEADSGDSVRRLAEVQCTHAYIITPHGARKLLDRCFPLTYQIDTEIWMVYEDDLSVRPMAVVPPCVYQDTGFASQIQLER